MAGGGGAWKVAYADFITAMMALFMVLWILGSEEELLKEMQEYFRNPPSPWTRESGKFLVEMGDFEGLLEEDFEEAAVSRADPALLMGIIEDFYKLLKIDVEEDAQPPVEIMLTADGLRMVIFDRQDSPLFDANSDTFTQWGAFLMQNLSWLLTRHGFRVVIEGHGDPEMPVREVNGQPFGPWELSVSRANAVRRSLEFYAGEGALRIQRVVGYGDTQPVEQPNAASGRTHQRITLSLSLPGPDVEVEDGQ